MQLSPFRRSQQKQGSSHSNVAAALCFALILCCEASKAFGQTPQVSPEEEQRRNLEVLRNVVGTPSANSPMMKQHTATPAVLSLPQHINEISAMDAKIRATSNPKLKAELSEEKAMRVIHLNQEEWQIPSLTSAVADPLLKSAFKQQGVDPVLVQVLAWNHAALDINALDHTAVASTDPNFLAYAEQFGPPCSSRALAIVHLAIMEALNLIEKKYPSYTAVGSTQSVATGTLLTLGMTPASLSTTTVDENSAVAYAAFEALSKLYPYQVPYLNLKSLVPANAAIAAGVTGPSAAARIALGRKVGAAVADELLKERAMDHSQKNGRCDIGDSVSSLVPQAGYSSDPNYIWKEDSIHQNVHIALGSNWSTVDPWVLSKPEQFRPAKVDTTSSAFFDSFEYSRVVGGDPSPKPVADPMATVSPTNTERTDDQTESAIFWAYDGTPGLCAPPRLYNMVVTSIATQERKLEKPIELARLLSLVNLAMADAAISSWEAKYYFRLARPVTAIRAYKDTMGKTPYSSWTPLGAQITNTDTVNFTPPFPAYPSGHATFGGAVFQVLRDFYRDDPHPEISFDFVSDEWNGMNADPKSGAIRPRLPRHYQTLGEAESENAMSRVYMGIHWKNDADSGTHQGNCVGSLIDQNLYTTTPAVIVPGCN